MPLDKRTKQKLKAAMAASDEPGGAGPRPWDDAMRLWQRTSRFLSMKLVAAEVDREALELACYALQLPLRRMRTVGGGRLARSSLKDRAEDAAELLLQAAPDAGEPLLDRATRILHEMPHRSPMLDEARLLADALNLDDFGITGLIQQAIQSARQGEGLKQVADSLEKREQYGYWEARLKDGFHFEPIRQIARRRLDNARHAALLLTAEMKEDAG